VGDPARYFYGVAKKIFSEHVRKTSKRRRVQPPVASNSNLEPHLKCLDECLDKLDPDSRELILAYYQEQKQAKIQSHKKMEESLNINAGALRARTHRLRLKLQKCVLECLQRAGESNDIN
jgi:DNA-directed RNA polymerase specialized sigma24 family protein